MIKPLWAIAGVALLGTAGVAGALVVTSPGGEEEAVQQVETATPSASATPSSLPTRGPSTTAPSPTPRRTPGPGETLYRWSNLELLIPDGSGITAGPGAKAAALAGRDFVLVKGEPEDSRITSTVVIDGDNGAILEDEVLDRHRSEIDRVLATLRVSAFDRTTAPWPYGEDLSPNSARESVGGISYVSPSPATGLYVGWGLGDPGGLFIHIRNERSVAFVQENAATGDLGLDTALVIEDDKAVFERWLATVQQCDTETAC